MPCSADVKIIYVAGERNLSLSQSLSCRGWSASHGNPHDSKPGDIAFHAHLLRLRIPSIEDLSAPRV